MWWSFGSGLLADWCVITWTLWQYLDYGDCDSVAGGSTFADCTALTWQSTALVIMTGLGQGLAIGAYREQAKQMRRSRDASGSLQMNMNSLGVMDLDLSISPDVFGLRAFDTDSPIARMLPGSTPCELRLMLPDAKLGIDGFHTTYRVSDYASPVGDYGLPLHHPRFIEWIGVPQLARLIKISGARWVDKLSRDQAVAAVVHLQHDVGLMQTNVDVLDQYALSLQKTASRMIELCLGSRGFPAKDVAAGALGPRVRRAAVQMEAMGLWRPSLDPLRLH